MEILRHLLTLKFFNQSNIEKGGFSVIVIVSVSGCSVEIRRLAGALPSQSVGFLILLSLLSQTQSLVCCRLPTIQQVQHPEIEKMVSNIDWYHTPDSKTQNVASVHFLFIDVCFLLVRRCVTQIIHHL